MRRLRLSDGQRLNQSASPARRSIQVFRPCLVWGWRLHGRRRQIDIGREPRKFGRRRRLHHGWLGKWRLRCKFVRWWLRKWRRLECLFLPGPLLEGLFQQSLFGRRPDRKIVVLKTGFERGRGLIHWLWFRSVGVRGLWIVR